MMVMAVPAISGVMAVRTKVCSYSCRLTGAEAPIIKNG